MVDKDCLLSINNHKMGKKFKILNQQKFFNFDDFDKFAITNLDDVKDFDFNFLDFKIEFKILRSPGFDGETVIPFYKDIKTLKSFINYVNKGDFYLQQEEISNLLHLVNIKHLPFIYLDKKCIKL